MEKYLFTDGTNVNREVESREALLTLIQSSTDPLRIRIWVFNSSEWLSLAEFRKRSSAPIVKEIPPAIVVNPTVPQKQRKIPSIIKKGVAGLFAVAAIFLVYNFTRVSWHSASAVSVRAERPFNTPLTNVDSLIETIEWLRGQKLDKVTRTNLRIRNNWPDLLQLQLTAERDTSREGSRYYNLEISIDNSTGYHIDNAEVRISVWKDRRVSHTDTLSLEHFGYATPARRTVEGIYKGDSLSVSFSSIRSRAFNFCYSAEKKSNYGNYNDRWFCTD
ncbi:MAG: hypothetical protein H7Y42_11225 [Chitinophagaceae bacterium]|nr:hypothetical protein [Chitinophagaceae bacterium]